MGYNATSGGYVRLKSAENAEYVAGVLEECFAYVGKDGSDVFDISDDGKYYGDAIEDALSLIERYVEEGEIRFYGEDDCHWRFVFRNGHFEEENGDVYYESEMAGVVKKALAKYKNEKEQILDYDRLLQICRAYISDDSDDCETYGGTLDPVRHRLIDTCECTKEEIEALGLSWMFFEEEEDALYK